MPSSYHMECKTFIEASCTNGTHTWQRFFEAATFEGLWDVSFQTE